MTDSIDTVDEKYRWELSIQTDQSCFQFRLKCRDGNTPSKEDIAKVGRAVSDVRAMLIQQGWKAAERVAPIK